MDESLAPGMSASVEPRKPTPREALVYKKERLEKQLLNVNNAIAALDEHPEIDKVLALIALANLRVSE